MTYEHHRRECGRKSLFLRQSKFMKAFDKLRFKSITTDNGSEFADLSLPRKILNYKTPEECFDVELDHIYRCR